VGGGGGGWGGGGWGIERAAVSGATNPSAANTKCISSLHSETTQVLHMHTRTHTQTQTSHISHISQISVIQKLVNSMLTFKPLKTRKT